MIMLIFNGCALNQHNSKRDEGTPRLVSKIYSDDSGTSKETIAIPYACGSSVSGRKLSKFHPPKVQTGVVKLRKFSISFFTVLHTSLLVVHSPFSLQVCRNAWAKNWVRKDTTIKPLISWSCFPISRKSV